MASRSALSGTLPAKYPPARAPATEGGAIQPNRRQLIRPARIWLVEALAAAIPETAMFAPPPAAGEDAASTNSGSRRLPSTRPTAPPASATANDQAPTPRSSRAPIRADLRRPHRQSRHGLSGRRRKRAIQRPHRQSRHGLFWSASQASALDGRTGKSRHGLFWSASQASALDGRTGKAGRPLLVGVASERLGRPHRQSRHGLFWSASQASALDGRTGKAGTASSGRRRKRAPWTAAPAKPARPLLVGVASERLGPAPAGLYSARLRRFSQPNPPPKEPA